VNYIIYNDIGKILRFGGCPEESFDLQIQKEGEYVVGGVCSDLTDFISEGAVSPRPQCPAVMSGSDIVDIPTPALLTINGTPYDVDVDSVSLSFPNPGSYKLVLKCWPYLDKEFEVNV
jgi:hypothetical protein